MSEAHAEEGESVAKKVFIVTMVGSVLFISAAFIVAFST
jgi:hypothetical protein